MLQNLVLREDDTYEESVSLNSFNGGDLTIRSEYPDDWDCIESTIVDPPSINDNVFERTNAITSSPITLTIQGLTIKNGNNGIYLVETLYSYELVVQYCIIEDNAAYGILSNNITVLTVENCKIRNNNNGIRTTHNWRNTLEIYDSEITGNTMGGVTDDLAIEIENCTIANNGVGVTCRNGTIYNSIIWDNTTQIVVVGGGETTVAYSDVEGGCIGTGNINSNPIFETVGDNDYYLTWDYDDKSPCIDTGDPDPQYNDPDDTRNDMGAYYHPHEVKTYVFEDGWTWLCFDILDIYYASTNNQVQFLLEPIKLDLDHGEHERTRFSYNPFTQHWHNGTELVISPKGYKIEMDTENSIDVSGFRCVETTTFDLYAEAPVGNWIGYFVSKTQHVYDAFDGYLDNIYFIQHQEWSIDGSHGGWPDIPYTLSPGDMVMVECEEDIREFCWFRESEAERFIVQEPQSFSYTEEVDYIPIYLYLEPTNLPDEIGVLIDGDCKGATVVHDTLANICAYITGSQGILEFEFTYGNRGINTSYKEYVVYDPETGYQETTTIDLKDKQDYYYVSFRSYTGNDNDNIPIKLSVSNYPNPFNPTTTISYDLPSDGNIELSIYNIRGQHVKILIMGEQIAGSYEVIWNGKDNNEKSVSSGIYFYKLSTKDETIMKKILMLK